MQKSQTVRSFSFGKSNFTLQDAQDDDDIEKMEEMCKNNKRSKLHNIETLKWLRKKS